ncbi:aspartate-semialdehyde dehydrogenase [Gloeomargarita lithophora Alchichica-D10]|uniref:Aspartate-semialdehyde dehydrogenase n=1 Tax=Gloeomargarita lithophora Alchichica-D10 TaxID=1188229 RepID=A0A1J0ABW4_9CYAN|nr:aspartate-semialdehyde dehydrogenase [Gloeomargarita lithophora]APB33419.1 aspartate-semialdehyde dehydrogenase [Gloeomargarita lithophora Alchichica-D10]
MATYRVGILGATGAVGAEIRQLLAERQFPVGELRLLASPRSAGQTLAFAGESLPVRPVSASELQNLDIVLASAGGSVSREWAPVAVQQGAVVIDNSSAFRLEPGVPLVVPEVNPQALQNHRGIIANPNCTTILLCVVIYPLHQAQSIQRVVVATYQSASGAGARAMQELLRQTQQILENQPATTEIFPYPLAFNLFPHNSPCNDQGYCQEELKMIQESRKIMGLPALRLTATCVRVPVLRAHSEAVNLEFSQPFPVAKAQEILGNSPGVELVENWQNNYFPMPIHASGKDAVLVGRIRQDLSHPCGLDLWLCGDQIRKGAALNAVQIAEYLIQKNWL